MTAEALNSREGLGDHFVHKGTLQERIDALRRLEHPPKGMIEKMMEKLRADNPSQKEGNEQGHAEVHEGKE